MNHQPGAEASTLPQQLAVTLRQEINRDFHAGDKLPGMHALRARFGVSINTVAAALDMLAGEGLLEKRRGSGVYVTARADTLRLGILSELDLYDPHLSLHFRAVMQALRVRLQEHGAVVTVYSGHAEPGPAKSDTPTCPQFWDEVAAGRLNGAVVLDTPATDAWYLRLQQCAIPLVGPLTGYDAELDFSGIVKAAVSNLVARGCRRLGLLSGPGRDVFMQAVAAPGVSTHESWLRSDQDAALRGAGWEQLRDLWASPAGRPDGLVVLDDMLFADAQLAIFELGIRVPEDLQLAVLVNRGALPMIRLPVTTIEVDPQERAEALASLLLSRLRGDFRVPVRQLLPFREGAFKLSAPTAALVADAHP